MIFQRYCVLTLMFIMIDEGIAVLKTRDLLKGLREELISRQDKWIPPFHDNSTSVDVTLDFNVISVRDLDSVTETLTVLGYLYMTWEDPSLTWNPDDYQGQYLVEVRQGDIWVPSVSLTNSVYNMNPVQTGMPIVIFARGRISWILHDTFGVACKINVSRFPFDTQTCSFLFIAPYGYKMNLGFGDTGGVATEGVLDENGEWDIQAQNRSLREFEAVNMAEFTITLQRKTTYYIINFIFPMCLMSILNPFVFLIPARSGEKLSFLMAVFVSHALFLNLIHQIMPPTSDDVSRISLFLAIIETQGFLTIVCTIIVLGVHHRKEVREATALSQSNNNSDKQDSTHCSWFSLERFLDGLFFVLSFAMAGCSFLILIL